VAIEGNALVVYTGSTARADADKIIGVMSEVLSGFDLESAKTDAFRELYINRSQYTKMLRFELIDPDTRAYRAARWRFLGSSHDWIDLPGFGSLTQIVEDHVKHLKNDTQRDVFES